MASSASASALGSDFDDFLYASIGEDRNEMPLSVLSALARLDIDPWREAAELAQLPRDTATQRLASLIAALSDWPSLHLEPGVVAARLIALLPRVTRSNILSHETLLSGGALTNYGAVISMLFIYMIIMILMMGTEWVAASRQPSTQDNVQAPASTVVFPPLPPPNSGQ